MTRGIYRRLSASTQEHLTFSRGADYHGSKLLLGCRGAHKSGPSGNLKLWDILNLATHDGIEFLAIPYAK
jgi:hypothetical protein